MWHWGFYNLQSKTICLIKQTSFCSTHVCSCIGGTPPVTYNIFGMPGIPSQCLYILGTCQAYRKNKGASCDWCTTPPVLVARPRMLYNPAIYFTTPSIFLQSQQSRRQTGSQGLPCGSFHGRFSSLDHCRMWPSGSPPSCPCYNTKSFGWKLNREKTSLRREKKEVTDSSPTSH